MVSRWTRCCRTCGTLPGCIPHLCPRLAGIKEGRAGQGGAGKTTPTGGRAPASGWAPGVDGSPIGFAGRTSRSHHHGTARLRDVVRTYYENRLDGMPDHPAGADHCGRSGVSWWLHARAPARLTVLATGLIATCLATGALRRGGPLRPPGFALPWEGIRKALLQRSPPRTFWRKPCNNTRVDRSTTAG